MAEGLDIRFGWHVSKIRWHAAGVDVTSEDGQTLHADAVVCTLPLGVLKVRPSAREALYNYHI